MKTENRISAILHIMWYESGMINECLNSINQAIQYSQIPIDIWVCLNAQTYLEKPIINNTEDKLKEVLNHPLFKRTDVQYITKTDKDEFYNIGDWRRDLYFPESKYTVWLETDTLVPRDYFHILSNVNANNPHILTLSSRKMWDETWDIVEHEEIKKYPRNGPAERPEQAPFPLNCMDYISQKELDEFNEKHPIKIDKLPDVKIDGSLLALSGGLPYPFIPRELSFVREDTCVEMFMRKKGIPQFNISTRIKGHNYKHPNKRTNTNSTREEGDWKKREQDSWKLITEFIDKI